ncbi:MULTISPECIES: class I mannose-6-phosphate isomerase [Bradyrhizobium]|uniref:class I mannose-6-phosphate isomerase n=1 Tax=Bradyrhizobium TaxID=374 RepID=UPI000D73E5DE|nr:MULTISPECIES: class I mannose-6-phosphate isomerase [Bradyrhizobium]AWO92060.1 class I mannose-6-phosphate isomerase [Bradyrhizobium diazoefficiens]QHP69867.1 mannose-6-phosphate isomerase [Bradyrhizobium sp. LCT2]
MTIEHAAVEIARKPWGRVDLRPWSSIDASADPVGELRLGRIDKRAPSPALLLKLLFTSQPLSIQVHPNDEFAHAIGLPNGKTEAWYILSAPPGARVALGLKRKLTPQALRAAIRDGSIAGQVQWRPAAPGDVIFVPGGTIHAIGANIVLAEIQQQSDTTFRLFDFGRQRELHEDSAVAASDARPSPTQLPPRRLTDGRTVLVASSPFVLERIDLQANSHWELDTDLEAWLLVIDGKGRIGRANVTVGEAIFIEADSAGIDIGPSGMSILLAYPGPDPIASLLQDCTGLTKNSAAAQAPTSSEIIEVPT